MGGDDVQMVFSSYCVANGQYFKVNDVTLCGWSKGLTTSIMKHIMNICFLIFHFFIIYTYIKSYCYLLTLLLATCKC